ncbi:MAG: bifunctional DNA-formamidopyrimidine glycosylase/DNA-(apurinic or apyrimidinic site) lyase [Gemmatimonadaceae bacterium]
MPELPEVETIARGVDSAVRDRIIVGVLVPRPDVLREATPAELARRTVGARITGASRRAKHIVISLDRGDSLVVQPRFTGALLAGLETELTEYDHNYIATRFTLDSGHSLAYRDVRRLGTIALMTPERLEQYFGKLGVEPLSEAFTGELLSGILRASRQHVKKVIMDQYKVVGVGNIYANEALWRAGIDPSRSSQRVSAEEASALRDAIVDVLREAIAAGGSSIRDYRNASGEEGQFATSHAAYGRAGKPCLRCRATMIGTHAVDGRQTVLCARCQR